MGKSSTDPVKVRLEKQIGDGFLPPYNLRTGRKFVVLRAGDPPEPDLLCEGAETGEQIGIEIGTAYYDPAHAKEVWAPARGKQAEPYSLTRRDSVENVRVLARALQIIRDKARKPRANYAAPGRLLLTVFAFPWRFFLSEVERRLGRLRVPVSHPFDEIYILSQHGEVYCVFPARRWVLR